jgi:hypothetical protein
MTLAADGRGGGGGLEGRGKEGYHDACWEGDLGPGGRQAPNQASSSR